MRWKGFDFSLAIMTVSFSRDVNPAGATSVHLRASKDNQKVVNEGFNLVLLDRQHIKRVVNILCKTGQRPCTAGHLAMHLIRRRDEACTKHGEAIMFNRILNTSFDLGHHSSTSVDTMKVLVNYAVAFDFKYGTKLGDEGQQISSTILCHLNFNQQGCERPVWDIYSLPRGE